MPVHYAFLGCILFFPSVEKTAKPVKLVLPNLHDIIKMHACILVYKSLNNDLCEPFQDYFNLISHDHGTRNNNCIIRLPKIKLPSCRKAFFHMGAVTFNDLPTSIGNVSTLNDIKAKLSGHFFPS